MTALLSTEMLKIRTTRVWWGMLIGLLVWAVLWSLPNAFFVGADLGAEAGGAVVPPMTDDAMARTVYTTALTSFGYAFTLVLGVLVVSGEYRHQTVTPTFLATPHRHRVVLAKWGATSVYALLYGTLALLASVAVTVAILAARGQELNLGAEGLPRALAFALLGFVLWGLIGIGLGTLLGNQVVAILVGVGFIFVEFVATIALSFVSWGPDLLKWLPSSATNAMLTPVTQEVDGVSAEILPWWGGLLVLLGYALLSAGLGAASTLRRDVT
ncbi:ABC transporter permease subunit [Thalassiella azotivora]